LILTLKISANESVFAGCCVCAVVTCCEWFSKSRRMCKMSTLLKLCYYNKWTTLVGGGAGFLEFLNFTFHYRWNVQYFHYFPSLVLMILTEKNIHWSFLWWWDWIRLSFRTMVTQWDWSELSLCCCRDMISGCGSEQWVDSTVFILTSSKHLSAAVWLMSAATHSQWTSVAKVFTEGSWAAEWDRVYYLKHAEWWRLFIISLNCFTHVGLKDLDVSCFSRFTFARENKSLLHRR